MRIVLTTIQNAVGLHARPAAVFVQTASKFVSDIKIRKTNESKDAVNAKSILQVLMLGACKDDQIELVIEGSDEVDASETLKTMIETDFAGFL